MNCKKVNGFFFGKLIIGVVAFKKEIVFLLTRVGSIYYNMLRLQ